MDTKERPTLENQIHILAVELARFGVKLDRPTLLGTVAKLNGYPNWGALALELQENSANESAQGDANFWTIEESGTLYAARLTRMHSPSGTKTRLSLKAGDEHYLAQPELAVGWLVAKGCSEALAKSLVEQASQGTL